MVLGWLARSFTPSQCCTSINSHAALDDVFATWCLDRDLGNGRREYASQLFMLSVEP